MLCGFFIWQNMITLNVRADIYQVLAKVNRIKEGVVDKAIVAALNKTAAKGKTEMVRQITNEYNIKAKDVRPQITVSKASRKTNKLEITIRAFGVRRGHRSRNVMLFDAKQVPGNGPPKRVNVQFPDGQWRSIIVREGGGVSVKIKRNGGRKLIPHAFIANKGRTVFMRIPGTNKIKAVETVDVPQMFNTRRVYDAVLEKIKQEFPVEMERAVRLYSSK